MTETRPNVGYCVAPETYKDSPKIASGHAENLGVNRSTFAYTGFSSPRRVRGLLPYNLDPQKAKIPVSISQPLLLLARTYGYNNTSEGETFTPPSWGSPC
jgi:hypothetical protein